ncbi:MAG TPA: PQQ-dependent sugar dehydrogenase, partial [Planctomycetaceae bacterium]
NRNSLLGKILRLDVESDPGRLRIPPANPFVNTAGARGEIWAYGLRNPWRFSFDRDTRDLWIADVGQDRYEEVDFQPASSPGGENYGWNRMEGLHCYTATCSQSGLVLPVAEYTHAEGGCSVTGGFVYRGRLSPGLRGIYLYGDLCSGRIWGIERQGTGWTNRQLLASGFSITTFGQDESGEIYVANAANGTIHRIEGSAAPRLTAAGIVNAASFAAGLVPGSLATIFAAGILDTPGALSVTIDGISAPILAVANRNGQEQANILVPAELEGRTTAQVVATRDGHASAPVTVAVFDRQPGVFTADGSTAVVVHNADYSLVTADRPLVPGEYAFLYATGLGRASADVRITLGGQACELQYAGIAPGFAGVYQVNFRAPALPSGPHDLVLSAGTATAPTVRTSVR